MKAKLWLGILYFFLTTPLISSATAFNCDIFEGHDRFVCEDIKHADINDELKETLYSNLGLEKAYYPAHDFIYDWNTQFTPIEPPEEVQAERGYWVTAWHKIFAVMPSVIEDDILYVPTNVTIYAPYYYEGNVPEDYISDGYPETRNSDCKTTYQLLTNNPELSIYSNNNYVGNTILTNLMIHNYAVIQSVFNVDFEVNVKHWKWDSDCIDWDDGECVEYEYKCEYDDEETLEDHFVFTDEIRVIEYTKTPFSNYSILDEYNSNTKYKFNSDNSTSFGFYFKDSYYQNFKNYYDVVYSYPPYYVLTLRAHSTQYQDQKNLYQLDDELIVKNSNDCLLFSWNHFFTNATSCEEQFQTTDLQIDTDKLDYAENETIKVTITPANTPINLTYGNQTIIAVNTAEFTAKRYANRITAELGRLKTDHIIFVKDKNGLLLIWNLSLFSLLNIFVFKIAKKGILTFM